jgi:predicted transcriptional regulator
MSRKKRDEVDEVEKLQKEIRELKSVNRTLAKQLRKLSKGAHRLAELEEIIAEEIENKIEYEQPEEKKKECQVCDKGELKIVELGAKNYLFCTNCRYRKETKKT